MKSHQSSQIVKPFSENVNIIHKGNENKTFVWRDICSFVIKLDTRWQRSMLRQRERLVCICFLKNLGWRLSFNMAMGFGKFSQFVHPIAVNEMALESPWGTAPVHTFPYSSLQKWLLSYSHVWPDFHNRNTLFYFLSPFWQFQCFFSSGHLFGDWVGWKQLK